jgi:DNA-binding CsgD family transcriptional regulator
MQYTKPVIAPGASPRSPGAFDATVGASRAASGHDGHLEIGVWEWDREADKLAWSDDLFRLLGFTPGEFTPTLARFVERLHPEEAEHVHSLLRAADGGRALPRLGCRIVRPDGAVRRVQMASAVGSRDPARAARRLVSFVADITEQRSLERSLAVHRGVLRALADWGSFEPGTLRLLREVAEGLGAQAAALWLPRGEALVARVLWSDPTVDSQLLGRALGQLRIARGIGLAGQAWERRVPVTCASSGADDELMTRVSAVLEGIGSILALPAVSGEDVHAVLVLYGEEPFECGELLASELSGIGSELGTFFARRVGMLTAALTPRELDVLALAGQGLNGPEMADALSLSTATVKTHLANVYAKIGVSNRVGAVAYALREGLIE